MNMMHATVTDEMVRAYKDAFKAYLDSQMFTYVNPADPSMFDEAVKKGLEAVAPLLRGVPEGYALVPIEPTQVMVEAGIESDTNVIDSYTAMLAATKGE